MNFPPLQSTVYATNDFFLLLSLFVFIPSAYISQIRYSQRS